MMMSVHWYYKPEQAITKSNDVIKGEKVWASVTMLECLRFGVVYLKCHLHVIDFQIDVEMISLLMGVILFSS